MVLHMRECVVLVIFGAQCMSVWHHMLALSFSTVWLNWVYLKTWSSTAEARRMKCMWLAIPHFRLIFSSVWFTWSPWWWSCACVNILQSYADYFSSVLTQTLSALVFCGLLQFRASHTLESNESNAVSSNFYSQFDHKNEWRIYWLVMLTLSHPHIKETILKNTTSRDLTCT